MAQFAYSCPHCEVRIGLDVVGFRSDARGYEILYLRCGACKDPSIALIRATDPHFLAGNWNVVGIVVNDLISSVMRTIPDGAQVKAPQHIPQEVERVFTQARGAHRRGDMDLAAMGYRRSVELALKAAKPEIRGQLGPRTDALAARQILDGSMKDWADNVRLLGNEASHDPPEPSDDAVEDLFLFTETLLEFLFTMPERVKLRRAATAEGKAGIERPKVEGEAKPALPPPG